MPSKAAHTDAALTRRLILWAALLVSVTAWIVNPSADIPLVSIGSVSIFGNDLIVACALVMGTGELLRRAGDDEKSLTRFACRLVIAYLLYQLLVVIPVAMWVDKATLTTVVRTMAPRFYWILLPALLPLFRDRRMRKAAAMLALAAAVVLGVIGIYLALTGGGGYYTDPGGGVRYRILGALAPPLFAWPLALAVSGIVPTLASLALGLLAVLGHTLTGFRSGIVAFGVAAVVGFFTSKRLARVAMWVIPAVLIGGVLYLLFGSTANTVYGYTINHLLDLTSNNAVDRLGRWRLAFEFFQAHPFNDYVWTWQRYLVNLTLAYEPHDFVLEVGTTEGIAGLAFYAAVLFMLLRAAWAGVWRDTETRTLACFLIAYLIFSSVNANWYAYSSMPLFVSATTALIAVADGLRRGVPEGTGSTLGGSPDPGGQPVGLAGADAPMPAA